MSPEDWRQGVMGTAGKWQGELIRSSPDEPFSFSKEFAERADQIFLSPGVRYLWDEIVYGAQVCSAKGGTRRFSAADSNTFRGFYRIDKMRPGAQEDFRSYFSTEKIALIGEMAKVQSRGDLHQLENRICEAIRKRLRNVIKKQLGPYNKIRKPVDLYIMNLVAMAEELDSLRTTLTPFLFLPMDSQIVQHPQILMVEELKSHGLTRRSTYKDVWTEETYLAVQELIENRSIEVAKELQRPFFPIYFDLLWGNRFKNWGRNLFETNP
jgi:hypothetical protein